jgi:poly(3-hydroxyalkanoate) depolymerase
MSARADVAPWKRRGEPFTGILDVEGQPLNVAIRPGRGTGTPLLLCNGIGANLELLDPLVAALGDAMAGTEVIRFDVPGIGGSPAPRWPYRFWSLARLVRRLLDTLGHPRADVMGISWGGLLAQQFAWSEAAHCRRLILAATVPGMTMVPGPLSALAHMLGPGRYGNRDVMLAQAPKIYGGVFRDAPERISDHWERLHGSRGSGYYLQMLAVMGWSSLYFLPLLRQPTLILSGDDDPLAPAINGRIMASLISRARLRILPCGHLFVLTHAEEVAGLVRDFVADAPAPVPGAVRAPA